MYLFYADRLGYIPMGNDGQMSILSHKVSDRKLNQLAEQLIGKRAGRVYLMNDWTQAMCELGPRAFEEYIARNGKVLISR